MGREVEMASREDSSAMDQTFERAARWGIQDARWGAQSTAASPVAPDRRGSAWSWFAAAFEGQCANAGPAKNLLG